MTTMPLTTTALTGMPLTGTARTAAGAVRALTRATHANSGGYSVPADLDGVLVELSVLVGDLPQLLTQAASWLDRAHQLGRVGHDTPTATTAADVRAVVHDVLADLERARRAARELAATLDVAHQNTSHLTGLDPTTGAGRSGGGRR